MIKTRTIENITYHTTNTVMLSVPDYSKIRRSLRHREEVVINTDGSTKIATHLNGKKTQHLATAWCLDAQPDFYCVESLIAKGDHLMSTAHVEAYAIYSFLLWGQKIMPSLATKKLVFRLDSLVVVNWANSIINGDKLNGNFVENTKKEVRNFFLDALAVMLHRNYERIRFEWVPSHDGNIGNERVDYLARLGRGEMTYLGTLDTYDYVNFLHQRTNISPNALVKARAKKALIRPGISAVNLKR